MSCTPISRNFRQVPSYQLPPVETSRLVEVISPFLKEHPGKTAILPLIRGDAALMSRLATLQHAQRSVDIQYYIWKGDLTGRLITHALVLAADRGVRVRILVDDLGGGRHLKEIAFLNHHPNIEIRLANPFMFRGLSKILEIFRFRLINRRMHNKTFIVDNILAIVGGRNIGDEYFDANGRMNFSDMDIWVSGSIVKDISDQFDTYWNHEISFPTTSVATAEIDQKEYEEFLRELAKVKEEAKNSPYIKTLMSDYLMEDFSRFPKDIYWADSKLYYDPPYKITNIRNEPAVYLGDKILPVFDHLEKELILVSPYFVPARAGMDFLKSLRKKGIEITILTNSLAATDVIVVFPGYERYRKELLDMGVKLYEFKPKHTKEFKSRLNWGKSGGDRGLHTKAFVLDREKIIVGSMNLDPRSKNLNTEIGIVAENSPFARDMTEHFFKVLPEIAYRLEKTDDGLRWHTIEEGTKITLKEEPETTWWVRFKASVLGVFVPEWLL